MGFHGGRQTCTEKECTYFITESTHFIPSRKWTAINLIYIISSNWSPAPYLEYDMSFDNKEEIIFNALLLPAKNVENIFSISMYKSVRN